MSHGCDKNRLEKYIMRKIEYALCAVMMRDRGMAMMMAIHITH